MGKGSNYRPDGSGLFAWVFDTMDGIDFDALHEEMREVWMIDEEIERQKQSRRTASGLDYTKQKQLKQAMRRLIANVCFNRQ